MHRVLLIDETLRLIFDFCLSFYGSKKLLCDMALCCKAWKNPALDCIWRDLPSAVPLMALLPGFSLDVNLTTFYAYANRVKSIHFRHEIMVSPDTWAYLCNTGHLLPNLQTCHIKGTTMVDPRSCTSISPRLKEFSLDVSYAVTGSNSGLIRDVLLWLGENRSLRCLTVRGYNTACLRQPFSTLVTLRSLSFHLSIVTESTFMAISSLPVLSWLDIHASSLSFGRLSSAVMNHCGRGTPFFPSLSVLKIRARLPVIELVLRHIPRNNLVALHMDIVNRGQPIPWHSTLLTITAASSKLRDLTIDDTEFNDAPRATRPYPVDYMLTMDDLRLLSKLPLELLQLDVPHVPDLTDADIEEIVTWWPCLQWLGLGSDMALENMHPAWQPKLTLASLSTLGKGCRELNELVITLDVASAVPQISCEGHEQLGLLVISSRSKPNAESLPVFIKTLFPYLTEVTPGYVGDYMDAWNTVEDNFDCL
ncbi:hypothetical protein J3A83DRAFT_4098960 [Scleroderma citrinum]